MHTPPLPLAVQPQTVTTRSGDDAGIATVVVDDASVGAHETACEDLPLTAVLLTTGRRAVSFSTPGHRQGRSCGGRL